MGQKKKYLEFTCVLGSVMILALFMKSNFLCQTQILIEEWNKIIIKYWLCAGESPVDEQADEGDEMGKMLLSHVSPLLFYFPVEEQYQEEDVSTRQLIQSAQSKTSYKTSVFQTETPQKAENMENKKIEKLDVSMKKLKNFNYLLGHFYTVDHTTTIGKRQLDAKKLLKKPMKIDNRKSGPKILIFHSHSQEAFADSNKKSSTSIVGIGSYLTKRLQDQGIETMHHKGVYDLIDGKMDRSKAYDLAEVKVKKILEKNPSIQVAIDLHRDGVGENTHLVTNINGKQTAQIMFFNGLSRTKKLGNISYLKNPYLQDNLAFSFQMKLACEKSYPGFARRIYLKGYRYNLHLLPKSLLIEAGAQTNTVEEMKNAMDILAVILHDVLCD